jgi:hypothetical protein
MMVRVEDVIGHYERAHRIGIRLHQLAADFTHAERQYSAADLRDIAGVSLGHWPMSTPGSGAK